MSISVFRAEGKIVVACSGAEGGVVEFYPLSEYAAHALYKSLASVILAQRAQEGEVGTGESNRLRAVGKGDTPLIDNPMPVADAIAGLHAKWRGEG